MGVIHHHPVGDLHVFFARHGCGFQPFREIVQHALFQPRFLFERTVEIHEIGRVAVAPFVLHRIVYGVAVHGNNVVFGMIFFKHLHYVLPHIRAVAARVNLKSKVGFSVFTRLIAAVIVTGSHRRRHAERKSSDQKFFDFFHNFSPFPRREFFIFLRILPARFIF